MDHLTPECRSWNMARIRSKDTEPELWVRRLVHSLGFRYRLHRRSLPGCPDLVFPSKRKVIFVQGCYWHRHDCPNGQRMPKSNTAYWAMKFQANQLRDIQNLEALRALGWEVLQIWECELEDQESWVDRIEDFLRGRGV